MKNRGSVWTLLLVPAILIVSALGILAIHTYQVVQAEKLVDLLQDSPDLTLTAQANMPGVKPYNTFVRLDLSRNNNMAEAYVDGTRAVFGGTLSVPPNPHCAMHSIGLLKEDSALIIWDCGGALSTEELTQFKFLNMNSDVEYVVIPMQIRVSIQP